MSGYPPGFVTCIPRIDRARWITPRRRRLTLLHDDIGGMDDGTTPAPAVRLLIPDQGQRVYLPTVTADGLEYPAGAVAPMPRTFTIRNLAPEECSLDVDVIAGHDGPAARWASSVEVGAEVGVAGPRRFAPLPDADRYVLLGDETAIPAIESMLEQDRWPHATVAAGIVADADHHVEADPRLRWLMPGGPSGDAVRTVLDELVPHDDATVVWIAGEAGFVKAVRRDLDERATPPRHVRAAGYWRRSRTSTEVDDQILERTNELIATGEDLAVLDEFALAVPD